MAKDFDMTNVQFSPLSIRTWRGASRKRKKALGGTFARPSLPPRRERVVERALAGGTFFDRDDGAALVDVDQRHVEPRTLLQELQIARPVGIDVGEADQEEAVGDFHRKPRHGRAAARPVGL